MNGPLLNALAAKIGYHDCECIDLVRWGGPLVGKLPSSGNGKQLTAVDLVRAADDALSVDELCTNAAKTNKELVVSIREDRNFSGDLLKICLEDFAMGRMSKPQLVSDELLASTNLSPRFCVEQGVRADGSPKLRAVDDCSRSFCNSAVVATERLHYDGLDTFLAALRQARCKWGLELEMWKADIDSAYRRIPVAPEHRRFAWVVFKRCNVPLAVQHFCLPFGSVASVHNWDRIGAIYFRFRGVAQSSGSKAR